ncbi:hypothetical protein INS49_007241 [Diaporthe citri]|uniref:uncharacterized protein n=1 Tax=Diaporthe citri TaxID=83186 RepID=UPI001C808CF9|nr:uncharacterized protein INS49_007241 [Diaporthe citri]KAG6365630.1 hypothetical protein INS49_007241 [Diaporthe citri]
MSITLYSDGGRVSEPTRPGRAVVNYETHRRQLSMCAGDMKKPEASCIRGQDCIGVGSPMLQHRIEGIGASTGGGGPEGILQRYLGRPKRRRVYCQLPSQEDDIVALDDGARQAGIFCFV